MVKAAKKSDLFDISSFDVKNKYGNTMSCSLVEPKDRKENEKLPCVVYAHSFIGNKLEGIDYAKFFMP